MSAWIVDKAVIDLLVEAFFRYEIVTKTPMAPDELGTLLWRENYRSVNYRYIERRHVPAYAHDNTKPIISFHPDRTHGTVKEAVRNGLLIYTQIGCYQYQSCEHPGWQSSAAFTLTAALQTQILTGLQISADEANTKCFGNNNSYPWLIEYA